MSIDFLSIAAIVGGSSYLTLFITQIVLIFAYRGYYLKRYGRVCRLPVFRLLGWNGETVLDNISHLEFSDPLGWRLRWLLVMYYLAMLLCVLSVVVGGAALYLR